jgi:hypothetical protein
MVLYPKSTSLLPNEIARFLINDNKEVIFTQNFSANKIYKGRIGYRNLENVIFKAIPIFGKPSSMGRLQLVVPAFSPAFEVLINGIVYSFSSSDEDIIIQSDDIPDGFFELDVNSNIVLNLTDTNAKNFGAKLELKTDDLLLSTDIVIGIIPVNSETFDDGNVKIQNNVNFTSGEQKSGIVDFAQGETQKRILFDVPYLIGDGSSTTIAEDSNVNYSIFIFAEGNVTTFYSDKAVNGFKINLERESGFSGKVHWRTILYERSIIEEKVIDISNYQTLFDTTEEYSVLLQPGLNANVWTTDISEDGFTISSDTSFVGKIDLLLIPKLSLANVGVFDETGSVFIPKGEEQVSVSFVTPRPNNQYRVFLQPTDNVRVFFLNKSNEGFTIAVEPDTDFTGTVDWQIHSTALSDTINFEGGNIRSGEPLINIVDLPETSRLGSVIQGIPTMSIIEENGVISSSTNGLQINYNTDVSVNPGLSVVVNNDTISYNNIRVYASIDDVWVEFQNASDFSGTIETDTKIFHARVNKDKLIGIKFGKNDDRGFDPTPHQIVIIGLECVGVQGNIGENILSDTIVGSLNFNSNDVNTVDVQEDFIELLGIKKNEFFTGNSTPVLLDYANSTVGEEDLTVIQLGPALFGSDPEGTDSIRVNAQNAHKSQLRTVTNSDYKSSLKQEFGDFLIDIDVFNYKEAQKAGLLSVDEVAKYYFNTLFFMMIPSFGTSFNILQRETIQRFLDEKVRKSTTVDAIILEPTFIPIDVIVSYSVKEGFSAIDVKDDISQGILNFFDRRKRQLGETITIEALRNNITSSGLSGISMQLNKDPNNEFSNIDYDVDIVPEQYESKFADVQEKQLQEVVRGEIRTLLDKGLIQINQPLFDIQSPSGERDWIYSGDLTLERFEFPILGDIVTEKRN